MVNTGILIREILMGCPEKGKYNEFIREFLQLLLSEEL